jgi:hypothetical protein
MFFSYLFLGMPEPRVDFQGGIRILIEWSYYATRLEGETGTALSNSFSFFVPVNSKTYQYT